MAKQSENNISFVVNRYGKRLFKFIRGRVRSNEDAEDILQDVWYQFSRAATTDPIEHLSGWLFRVARNRLTDNYRKQKPDLLDDYALENEAGDYLFKEILLSDDNNDPELANFKELFWEALWDALEELPTNQKEVFIWNELEDQTFQEISDRTGINIKTLISRKGYAVQHLRKRLANLYEEFLKT